MPPWAVCTMTGILRPASRILPARPCRRDRASRGRARRHRCAPSAPVSMVDRGIAALDHDGLIAAFLTMFSTRRRCTGSSSAIKMLAAMAFLARYNYLSRIGALWPMPINALLSWRAAASSLAIPPVPARDFRTQVTQQDDLALLCSPQDECRTQTGRQQRPHQGGKPAGRLPEWNLADLYAGIDAPEVARDLAKWMPIASPSRQTIKASSPKSAKDDGGPCWPRR